MKSTSVVHNYKVDYDIKALTNVDDEDDIVTAAVFAYQMNESFGDEATFWLYKVTLDKDANIKKDAYWSGGDNVSDTDVVIAQVMVTVRAQEMRM